MIGSVLKSTNRNIDPSDRFLNSIVNGTVQSIIEPRDTGEPLRPPAGAPPLIGEVLPLRRSAPPPLIGEAL